MRWDHLYLAALGTYLPSQRESAATAVADGLFDAQEYERYECRGVTVAGADEPPPDMAVWAARRALSQSDHGDADFALLLHASMYHQGRDLWTPAHYVQRGTIGGPALAVDVYQGANGSLAALELAASHLMAREGGPPAALITCADSFPLPGFDRWRSDSDCVFGDGAVAAVLSRDHGPLRLLATASVSDPELEPVFRGNGGWTTAPHLDSRPIDLRGRKQEWMREQAAGRGCYEAHFVVASDPRSGIAVWLRYAVDVSDAGEVVLTESVYLAMNKSEVPTEPFPVRELRVGETRLHRARMMGPRELPYDGRALQRLGKLRDPKLPLATRAAAFVARRWPVLAALALCVALGAASWRVRVRRENDPVLRAEQMLVGKAPLAVLAELDKLSDSPRSRSAQVQVLRGKAEHALGQLGMAFADFAAALDADASVADGEVVRALVDDLVRGVPAAMAAGAGAHPGREGGSARRRALAGHRALAARTPAARGARGAGADGPGARRGPPGAGDRGAVRQGCALPRDPQRGARPGGGGHRARAGAPLQDGGREAPVRLAGSGGRAPPAGARQGAGGRAGPSGHTGVDLEHDLEHELEHDLRHDLRHDLDPDLDPDLRRRVGLGPRLDRGDRVEVGPQDRQEDRQAQPQGEGEDRAPSRTRHEGEPAHRGQGAAADARHRGALGSGGVRKLA